MFMTQILGTNIVLPDLELTPEGPVRDKLISALVARDEYLKASRDLEAERTALDQLRASEVDRQAAILQSDPTVVIEDSTAAIDKAEKRVRVRMLRVEALTTVTRRALAEVHDAVDAESAKWAKKSVAATSRALTGLTTAIELADESRERLYATVGVLGMLRARAEGNGDRGLSLRQRPYGFSFAIEAAMDSLREALKLANDELIEHGEVLGVGPGKRPKKVAAVLGSAAADHDSPTAPAAAEFEIIASSDEEPDDE